MDDEEPNRALLRIPLEAHGYEVSEADSGVEALRSIAAQLPDTVLLDLMMPGMDGLQLCHRLKNDPRTAHIPVLMITALSDRKERLLGIEAGANDFLSKPVDLQDLALRVANAVRVKNLYDQVQAERDRADQLLLNTLPRPIAERMKNGESTIADKHADVTVLTAELVGFTALTAHIAAEQVVSLLNEIFSTFDLLVEKRGLEKVKMSGDTYMAAGGILNPRPDHAEAIIELAFDLRGSIDELNSQYGTSIQARFGICSGPVIAGVIGRQKLAYDLWSETVNVACRLSGSAKPGMILVAQSTVEKLSHQYDFGSCEKLELKEPPEIFGYPLIARQTNAHRAGTVALSRS